MHEVNEHNHVVNPAIVEVKIAVTEIRRRASNSRDPLRLVVQQAQATLSNEAIAEMPQYTTLQRPIQRKRKVNGDPIANPRAIEDIVIPINPTSIMCDFEIGFQNAARLVFGDNVIIVGCLFHLGRCIYRKILQLGLSEQYLRDDDTRLNCKMLVSLAFVPPVDVLAAFETLLDNIPADLEPLMDYFEDTWIDRPHRRGQRRNPMFSIDVWSIYDRVIDGLPRTNNSIEGWHSAFQRTVGSNHPTIYKLIEAMQLEQSHTENIIIQIAQGRTVVKKNACYERIDQAYRTIVTAYRRQHMDYLRAIAYNVTLNV